MSLFLRLLGEEDKGAALLEAVRSVAAGEADPRVFEVDPVSFEQVPGAPFAYWISTDTRSTFQTLEPTSCGGRQVKVGVQTGDDFRFVRLGWEVPSASTLNKVNEERNHKEGFGQEKVLQHWAIQQTEDSMVWVPFAKGGAFAPFYADVVLVVNWHGNGAEIKNLIDGTSGKPLSRPQNTDYAFLSGLTWSDRTTSSFSARVWPSGGVFSVKGSCGFFLDQTYGALALLNSKVFNWYLSLLVGAADAAAKSYQVGVISSVPYPSGTEDLSNAARRAWSLKRDLDTATLTSHAFVLPALLQVTGADLDARATAWSQRVQQTDQALAEIQSEIDARCFDLYGFDEADRAAAMGTDALSESGPAEDGEPGDGDEDEAAGPSADPKVLAAELFDWLVGVAFGRFDLRLATGERVAPPEPDPFDPLPVCSPGMLTGEDGLPLAEVPPDYPLAFPAGGILVDDGDESLGPSGGDPIARIRSVLQILGARIDGGAGPGLATETLEADLCRLLGVKTLRDWLRRPAGFFADHLGRWSKSRRKAPIYWPLSTESGGYTLWVYYPRLTDQTLYTCVNDHIDPKLQEIGADLERLRGNGDLDAKTRKRADALLELEREIGRLRVELLRVARLPYKPDENDGVLITAAPLRHLFRHKPWQKELAKCWDTLEAGGYDWAHLALARWPERVRKLCRTDKSVAIAHGLEDLYGD